MGLIFNVRYDSIKMLTNQYLTMEDMMDYIIVSDVSLDIDKEFANTHDIKYIPMEYVLGEETFYCNEPESDERCHNFYESLRNKIKTQTSQITPQHYVDVFEPYVKEGKGILYLSLSSGLSKTYESALLSVENLKEEYETVNIEVVDSLAATGGMGLIIEMAFENMEKGMSLKENADWIREYSHKLLHFFRVEDLMYLKRGGRVSAATAVVATALNIKPILWINPDGGLDTIDKKRGNKLAMKNLVERFVKNFDPTITNKVYISCADCMADAEVLKNMVLEANPDVDIRLTMLSPIIGAHTGPDMIALIFFGRDRAEALE